MRGNVIAGSGRGHDPQGSPTASGGSINEAGSGHRHSTRDRSLPLTSANGYMPRRAGAKTRWYSSRTTPRPLYDNPSRIWSNRRSEVVQRLLADACELCGSTEQVEVHHIRALKDLNPKGRKHLPEWAVRMAARHRKTLVVCRDCHENVHAGRPTRQPR